MPSSSKGLEHGESGANALIMYSGALNIGYDFEPVIKAAKILNDQQVKFILRGAGTSANDVKSLNGRVKE